MKHLSLILIAFTAVACSAGNSVDYSKAAAQTGGPEQGEWRDVQGTQLSLNSGKFTYKKGVNTSEGSYTVSNGTITLVPSSGSPMSASFPDASGAITLDGEKLTKLD